MINPKEFGADREAIRLALEKENIESRPIWKPMPIQPVFEITPGARGIAPSDRKRYKTGINGGEASEDLFERELCLPSGTQMTDEDLNRGVNVLRRCHKKRLMSDIVWCIIVKKDDKAVMILYWLSNIYLFAGEPPRKSLRA